MESVSKPHGRGSGPCRTRRRRRTQVVLADVHQRIVDGDAAEQHLIEQRLDLLRVVIERVQRERARTGIDRVDQVGQCRVAADPQDRDENLALPDWLDAIETANKSGSNRCARRTIFDPLSTAKWTNRLRIQSRRPSWSSLHPSWPVRWHSLRPTSSRKCLPRRAWSPSWR